MGAIKSQDDGVTHINVYSKAQTELGRFLSNFSDSYTLTDGDGQFRTIEGYWYWLSTKDERLRHYPGYMCKKIGRELGGKDWLSEDEFQRKIMYAITVKIVSHLEMSKRLVETGSLPLTHYYVYGDKLIFVQQAQWIIQLIDRIRTELATGVIPYQNG